MSCKLPLRMSPTDEYERLVKFFAEQGLEFDGDEEVDTDIVQCYKMTWGDDKFVGGVCLAMREGRYIIDGIAVAPFLRGRGVGEVLLKKALSVVKKRGGKELYLVARAPEFFRKNGFITIPAEDAPNFFECKYCPQYMDTCHPEIMKFVLED